MMVQSTEERQSQDDSQTGQEDPIPASSFSGSTSIRDVTLPPLPNESISLHASTNLAGSLPDNVPPEHENSPLGDGTEILSAVVQVKRYL
jgi:hypothetical protein